MSAIHRKPIMAAAALLLSLGLVLGAGRAVLADSDPDPVGSPADPDYAQAAQLVKQEAFQPAMALLNKVIARDPENANAFNLLGYSSRKLGLLEEALGLYKKALAIAPKHLGANEYIGEAYLALKRPDQARKHLAVLDKECWLPCEEFSDLKAAIDAYEKKQG